MGGASSARRRVVDPATLSGVTPKHDRPFYMQLDLECHDFPLAPFFNSEAYGEHRASVNLEQQKINLERMARELRISSEPRKLPWQQQNADRDHRRTTRSLVLKLHADVAPYACENFRLLASRRVEEGGYVGSAIHEIHPTVAVRGGLGHVVGAGEGNKGSGSSAPRSASAFAGGALFRDESHGALDHGAYTLSMVSVGTKRSPPVEHSLRRTLQRALHATAACHTHSYGHMALDDLTVA